MGSDTLSTLNQWPLVEKLLKSSDLVIGIREGDADKVDRLIAELKSKPNNVYKIDSLRPTVSSTKIREALRRDQEIEGILPSVRRYSNRNWLYISLA